MSVAVLVMTDGRDDLLDRTLESWAPVFDDPRHVGWQWVMHDDSGDWDHNQRLREKYPLWYHMGGPRKGFAGAIATAWAKLADNRFIDYVLHIEDDFVLTREVDVDAMVEVMELNPHLAQMALLRQPWSPEEKAAGGIVQMDPGAYVRMATLPPDSHCWFEHRKWFTTNPSLYRRSLCERGWPPAPDSERKFSDALFADPNVRCAYWGLGEPWVEHIGHQRAGTGY